VVAETSPLPGATAIVPDLPGAVITRTLRSSGPNDIRLLHADLHVLTLERDGVLQFCTRAARLWPLTPH
jgi:hypothetical protein